MVAWIVHLVGEFGVCLDLLVAYSFASGVSGFVVICDCGYFVVVVVCGYGNVWVFYVGLALRIWVWFSCAGCCNVYFLRLA